MSLEMWSDVFPIDINTRACNVWLATVVTSVIAAVCTARPQCELKRLVFSLALYKETIQRQICVTSS